jgi:CheY-like chemotaxis protein/nitrogen-specific signal transduction histidine kinase
VVLRDVTERRQIETSMKEAQAEAERANLAKSEFLSRMSHELRTPLNAILGFAQVLEMDELSTEQQTSVGHILRGGEHLLGLINEVLDIARIEAGQMSLSTEPVQLSSIFQEAVAMVQPLTSGRQVQLHMSHIEEPPDNCFVRADRQRLKQVLLNLLSNAIKYNRHGGEVHLDWEEAADGQIIITVRDTGQGIAPDKMSKLFTPFDRLGAEQSNIEGTGIGLALSKRLVELMSGTLEATSVFGEGSTFRVTLPRAVDPAESVAELDLRSGQQVAHEQPKSAIVWTVLYIEDNLPNLQLVEQILMRRSDINLHSAMQGSIGLELALQHQPDLILLDLHLPDMHGEEVLSRLRQDDALRNTPVIVISADATPRQIARLKEAGVVDYLTKPLNVRRFLQLLDEILKV